MFCQPVCHSERSEESLVRSRARSFAAAQDDSQFGGARMQANFVDNVLILSTCGGVAMPGTLLHVGATVLCAHGGQAQPTAPNPGVLVSGQPIVTQAAPYVVAG